MVWNKATGWCFSKVCSNLKIILISPSLHCSRRLDYCLFSVSELRLDAAYVRLMFI